MPKEIYKVRKFHEIFIMTKKYIPILKWSDLHWIFSRTFFYNVPGYKCQLCRPSDVLPPHLKKPVQPTPSHNYTNSNPLSEYSSYSHYNSASFIVDGVILSERGMTTLKSQTVEKEKARRRKRVGIGGDPMNPNDLMDTSGNYKKLAVCYFCC